MPMNKSTKTYLFIT